MKVQSISLFVDVFNPPGDDFIDLIQRTADELEIDVFSALPSKKVLNDFPTDYDKDIDVAFVMGGDGTILRGMNYFAPLEKPIIGLNTGHLGFLAEAEVTQIPEVLKRISEGNFSVDYRPLLSVFLPGNDEIMAVNDVCLNRSLSGGILHLKLTVNEQVVADIPGDGIVVATPMGSTAYALSAGGPVMDPALPAILIAAICPHLLSIRPVVVPSSSEIIIRVSDCRGNPAFVVNDGLPVGRLGQDQSMKIRLSTKRCSVIKLNSGEFYNLLRRKFGWGHRGGN